MATADVNVFQNASAIDGKVVGNTLIELGFPEGGSATVFSILFQTTLVAGFLTAPTVSLGTNAANYDNILAATVLPISTQGYSAALLPTNNFASVGDGSNLYCRVSAGATGTTYNFYVIFFGFRFAPSTF